MDLIDDLGTDLALAFLVDRNHRQRIDSEDVLPLIRRIKAALQSVSRRQKPRLEIPPADNSQKSFSH